MVLCFFWLTYTLFFFIFMYSDCFFFHFLSNTLLFFFIYEKWHCIFCIILHKVYFYTIDIFSSISHCPPPPWQHCKFLIENEAEANIWRWKCIHNMGLFLFYIYTVMLVGGGEGGYYSGIMETSITNICVWFSPNVATAHSAGYHWPCRKSKSSWTFKKTLMALSPHCALLSIGLSWHILCSENKYTKSPCQ